MAKKNVSVKSKRNLMKGHIGKLYMTISTMLYNTPISNVEANLLLSMRSFVDVLGSINERETQSVVSGKDVFIR